jgi:hypothetical protein
MIKIFFIIFFTFSTVFSDSTLSDGKIQGRLNILNGYATECVMHKFYTNTDWIQIEGEVGRNGIDGLYYKKKNGVIREVLVAESKWNKARLGRSGKNKLLKQMSQEWVLRTLDRLQKYRPQTEYAHIRKLIQHDQYRARLFKMTPKGDDQLQIVIYKIKNKGSNSYETFVESTLNPITLNAPNNNFDVMILDTFNTCREEALNKYFPMLDSDVVEELKSDNYLRKEDIRRHL